MPGEIRIPIVGDSSQFEKDLAAVDKKIEETEAKTRLTVSNTLIALRAITDIAALVSVTTGEQIDVQFLSMISMGLSAMVQIQTMAAVYAATPGMQPVAMMMLAMIPVLTGMIGFIKSEQMKVQARIDKSQQQQLDQLLDGVNV